MSKSNSIECNSLETINKTVLSEQTNKYVTIFDYIDKILII